jgi:PAS domain S-box-containing protein
MNASENLSGHGQEILVADDTPASLQLLTQILVHAGYRVRPASGGPLAARSVAAKAPDLILLDVKMPDMDGIEFCRRLKADPASQDIPVLFISAMNEPAEKIKCFEAGGLDYITKPFDTGEVLSRVRIHLRLRELTEQLEQKVRERTAALTQANLALEQKISEQQRAEADLRESELRFRTLVDNLPVRVFIKNRESVYTACNPSYAADLHLRPEDIRGKTDFGFYPKELADKYREDDKMVMESGRRKELEESFIANERHLWIHTIKTPLLDEAGKVTGILGVFWDITERKAAREAMAKLETQFQQAQKMESLGQLAGGVAHDFNNMLQAILSNASLLLEDTPPNSPVREGLMEIWNCARRSADLTQQLLAFARRQFIAPKVLNLNETVEGMIKMLRRLVGENIELIWQPDPELGLVKMDPVQISQILANLCVNARDAIDGVGKIRIETHNVALEADDCASQPEFLPGEYVALSVSDTGCGMDKAILPHIFEPFFTTKSVGKGTGLGLPTVYGIVQQNHGFIQVYSEPGQGTVFKIYLPRHLHSASPPKNAPPPQIDRSRGETVLLVEDEPTILAVARKILDRLGYSVLAASGPAEALQLAESQAVHLLMTDVIMPEMNGLELAGQMAARQPALKCLFMSGYPAEVIAHHGVLNDRVHFIQKPFSAEDLAAKIRAIFDYNPQAQPEPQVPFMS